MGFEYTRLGSIGLGGDAGLVDGPFGSNLPASSYQSEGVPVIRGSNLTKGEARFRGGDFAFVSSELADKLARSTCLPKDIVFTKKGTLGQVGIVPDTPFPKYLLSSNQMRLRVDPARANANFVYYALSTKKAIERLIRGSEHTGVPKINLAYIRHFEIPLPPLPVQNAITDIVIALDDRIDLLRQTNATLEAIAQALFKSWFVDFDPVHAKAEGREPEAMDAATAALFPSEFEESKLGLIPKGWRVMPLLGACDLQGGTQPPASTFIDEPKAGYVRLLQIRDFSTDAHPTYIPESKNLRTARVDDILIGRYGSASGNKQKDSLGRICRGLKGAYNVALMKLVPGSVGREFAFQVFNDQHFYNYLQGVSAKAVQSGFSKKELALYKIVVPDDQVLERYESMGSAVWQQVKLNRQRMATLAQLRDTLLPRLISGKLRLPEATEAAEAALA